jgi:hypothetical protein
VKAMRVSSSGCNTASFAYGWQQYFCFDDESGMYHERNKTTDTPWYAYHDQRNTYFSVKVPPKHHQVF